MEGRSQVIHSGPESFHLQLAITSVLSEMQSLDLPSPTRSGSACHLCTWALCMHMETDII